MNFCPRNAHHFNHVMTPAQAREWCRTTNCNRDRGGCDYEHRWIDKAATGKGPVVKHEQGKLF